MTIAVLPRGQLITVPNMRAPLQGAKAASMLFTFSGSTQLETTLEGLFESGEFDFFQSVFIDNKDNASNFTLNFPGVPPNGFKIQAQPYSQGFYPITLPVGDGRMVATTTDGQSVPVVFYNCPMPYFVWGPVPGVLVVPVLTHLAVDIVAAAAGNNLLIAGVLGQTIKVYRTMLTFSTNDLYGFRSGATNLGDFDLVSGSGLTWQPSGVPWITTVSGDNLNLNALAGGGNIRGVLDYVQS